MTDIRPQRIRAPIVSSPSSPQATPRISSGSPHIDTLREGYDRANALLASLRRTQQEIIGVYSQVQTGHAREMNDVSLEAARKIKKPSTTRYSLFIILCIIADTAGAALITVAWTTTVFGVGIILGVLATALVTGIMWIGGRILLGKRAKEVKEQNKKLQEKSKEIFRDIEVVRQQYNSVLSWIGTAKKEFPQLASQGTALIQKAGAIAGKTNMAKYTGKAAVMIGNLKNKKLWRILNFLKSPIFVRVSESIPFWNALPWWTIGAGATYVSHRADWREAQDILNGYTSGKQEVMDTTNSLYKTRLTVAQAIYKKKIDTLIPTNLYEASRP